MKACGIRPSALGVAEFYKDFMDTLIIDRVDKRLVKAIERLRIKPVVTDTLMSDIGSKERLARIALGALKD
jgi:LPPG:FO 2-phospho-L-lactate transferase